MAETTLECWRCGAPLVDQPLPLARAAACERCDADLHVCRMCALHDPSVANECREPVADPVQDKERANFCGYLEPKPGAHRGRGSARDAGARSELDALFGLDGGSGAADGGSGAADGDPEQAARAELDRLFGLDKPGD